MDLEVLLISSATLLLEQFWAVREAVTVMTEEMSVIRTALVAEDSEVARKVAGKAPLTAVVVPAVAATAARALMVMVQMVMAKVAPTLVVHMTDLTLDMA